MPMSEGEFAGTRRFRIVGQLGEGGMGVVYSAVDREQGSKVALKTLRRLAGEEVLRLKREFRSLQDLAHPNLVTFGELFEEGGQWFFTMELVEGVDFVHWVRGGGELDETRLRTALGDLARALVHLHDAGVVHRDIKPTNIVVTPQGRLVLLDFGLAADKNEVQPGTQRHVLGSAAYMAPEQGTSSLVGPPADMYAVGILVYEALVGRVPLTGEPREVLRIKQRYQPSPPSTVVPSAPRDLDRLCVSLLSPEPGTRPTAHDLLRRVTRTGDVRRLRAVSMPAPPFVGRRQDLDGLLSAFDRAAGGRGHAVFIAGESGIGKTSLARRFVDEVGEARSGCLTLSGRCYERESVPFKAFDGIAEGLADHLARLAPQRLADVKPVRTAELVQLFPVLRRVAGLAEDGASGIIALDPREARARGFEALRELFARLAARGPVVVTIDDLHWADEDSVALLEQLLAQPGRPPVLWACTLNGIRPELAELVAGGELLELKPLSPGEAEELAQSLLGAHGSDASAALVAQDGGGHPLFIDELVRHIAYRSRMGVAPRRIEEALASRIAGLESPARLLLELVAVAGAPVAQDAIARAMGADAAEFTVHVSQLRSAHLVRTVGARTTDPVVCYHDRVRDAVLDDLEASAAIRLHEQLALALESIGDKDHDALAIHWMFSGETEKAASYAFLAAEQAMESFAFERAARLYLQAIQLDPGGGSGLWELQAKLAHALANSGHAAEAAAAYLSAAEAAPAADAIELRRHAATQYMTCGHIEEGLDAFEQIFEHLGLAFPRGSGAMLSLAWRRLWIKLRGLRHRVRTPAELPDDLLRRIDVLWHVSRGLSMIDTTRGADFHSRHLLQAVRAGEPHRLARALAAEAVFVATSGVKTKKRTSHLLELADTLAEQSGEPHAIATAVGAAAIAAHLQGRQRASLELQTHAERIYRERCVGVAWELDTIHTFAMIALILLGDVGEAMRRHPIYLRDARERGDIYLETNLLIGHSSLLWLARGEVDEARRARREAMQVWTATGFTLQHNWDLAARVHIDLYLGDGEAARARLREGWGVLSRSIYMRFQLARAEALFLRARAAIAAADDGKPDALGWADAAARRLTGDGADHIAAVGTVIAACAAAARGRADTALARLEAAEPMLRSSDSLLLYWMVRRRHGQLLGGDEGRALVEDAERWMAEQGITAREEMTQVFCPGFARLLAR